MSSGSAGTSTGSWENKKRALYRPKLNGTGLRPHRMFNSKIGESGEQASCRTELSVLPVRILKNIRFPEN